MNQELKTSLNTLPKDPGVYQYFDINHRLLYIGKAKNLQNRVRSYFSFEPTLSPKATLGLRIQKMVSEIESIEYIIVDSEHDALILENSLIKQLNPKYNILLRDDKTYPYFVIDRNQAFPRIEITREIIKDKKHEYFGPFSVGARDILDSLYELLPLVQKKSCIEGKKACLYHQINKCLAPCEGKITTLEYDKILKKALVFIKDKNKLTKALDKQMHLYAEDLRFEEAKTLRDRIINIEKSKLSTAIDLASSHHYDIFAIASKQNKSLLVKLFMREGKLISSNMTNIRTDDDVDLSDIYARSLIDYYTAHEIIMPQEILIHDPLTQKDELEELLSEHAGHKVTITHPQKGDKYKLTQLAFKNALELLSKEVDSHEEEDLLLSIQKLFKLENVPNRIEVFDNSHLQGVASVGGMVCYENSHFNKKFYRHYHLNSVNEYEQMRETLLKRIEGFSKVSPPDLWLLDGGKALLMLAKTLLSEAGIFIDVLAISKEKVDAKTHRAKGKANDIISNQEEAFKMPSSDKRLQFLQKLRDEAHRFAITFHKKTKQKRDKESQLLSVKGIGQAKVQKLLNYFGSFEMIKEASFEELRSIMNDKDAKLIENFYN